MSKRINVNPDHYKVAGRERQGHDVAHDVQRQAFARQQAQTERWRPHQQQAAESLAQPSVRNKGRQSAVEHKPPRKARPVGASKVKGKTKTKTKTSSVAKGAAPRRRPPARRAR